MAATGKAFETEPSGQTAGSTSWRRWTALSVVIIVVVGTALLVYKSRGPDREKGTRLLIEALAARRLIEPRLSGGFRHGEFRISDDLRSGVNLNQLERARQLITEAAASAEPSDELAYARLLLSQNEKLPEALKYLRRVLAAAPGSAEAHNDLGVCLILQGKLEDSIDEFEAALNCKADMPEALFNRGFCYQKLLLTKTARDDFDRVAKVERDRGWLEEIVRRSEQASRPPTPQKSPAEIITAFDAAIDSGALDEARKITDESDQFIRRHAYLDVSVELLQAALDGQQPKEERALLEMNLIGNTLVETRGESFILDAARYLNSLPSQERQSELDLIREYVGSVRTFDSRSSAPYEAFDRLRLRFRERGNTVFEMLSAFQVADCYYYLKRFTDSMRTLKNTLSLVEKRKWPYDRARMLALLGFQYSRLGQDSLAIKILEQAIALSEKSPSVQARSFQYLSAPYLQLGDLDSALARLRDSTQLLLEKGLPSGIFASLAYNYLQIASIHARRNQHGLALNYAEHALDFSNQANNLDYSAEFSSFIAREQAALNQPDRAEESLNRAFDYLGKIEQGRSRDFTEARVLSSEGEVAVLHGDLPRAIACYDKAEALAARDEGHILQMIETLRDRAKAYAALGRNEKAYADLMRAVTLVEQNRAAIESTDQRIQYLAASRSVFEQLISLDAGTPAHEMEAFAMSERSRARALLEEISHEQPMKLADVQAQLPKDLTLLEYVVTEKRTYVFLVTQTRFKIIQSTVTTELLDRLVHDYVSDLQRIAALDEVNDKARVLYDYLVKPVEAEISSTGLCIVPDEALHFLPFAALVDSKGKYLVESRRLTYAPSASVLVSCIREAAAKSAGEVEKILAVANPELSDVSSFNLPSLPDSEREADESARFYSGSGPLTRARATESSVRAAMKDCEVIHFAIHCLVDGESPGTAALVLAGASPDNTILRARERPGESGGPQAAMRAAAIGSTRYDSLPQEPVNDSADGLLFLKELYGVRLPRTRLVVLSACQSGLGKYYRGEGMVSLVRPFMASAVPTVVASLWPIDSTATADLMIEFHRQRKVSGMQEGDALRAAQIRMAASGPYSHPYYWAPFIVIGGTN